MCIIKKYVHKKNLKKIHSERRIQKHNQRFYFSYKEVYVYVSLLSKFIIFIDK